MAQLAEQAVAVGDDVVLVDRLEVLLARGDERVVAQLGQPVDDAADHLPHAVLDESRAAVGLLDHRALVGALHQLVDLRRHRVLDDREQPAGVDVGVAALRAADVERAQAALVVRRDGHGGEDALDLVLAEPVREQPLARALLHERLRARAGGHALGGDAAEPARAGGAGHRDAVQRVDLLGEDAAVRARACAPGSAPRGAPRRVARPADRAPSRRCAGPASRRGARSRRG